MKTIILSILFSSLASVAFAGPSAQYWDIMQRQRQSNQRKAADQITFICSQHQTASAIRRSSAQAMDACGDGARVTCPACAAKAKVAQKPQRTTSTAPREVVCDHEADARCACGAHT